MYRTNTNLILCCVCCLTTAGACADESTGDAGGGQSHSNIQPSLGLKHCIALVGVFPSRNAPEIQSRSATDPFLGEIMTVGFNFCPRGWADLDGQLLDISTNSALFALLGTTYGGDGRTTFGLPDLRGRTAVDEGQGPGLSNWPLGVRRGIEAVTLTEGQMPVHNHTLPDVLLGDMNGDGVVDGLDVDPFVEQLLNGGVEMNGSEATTGLDVAPFVSAVLTGGAQPVPEPSTLLLALVALIGMTALQQVGPSRAEPR